MAASDAEFRNRFWIIGLIFAIGFMLTAVDHKLAAIWLLELIHRRPLPDNPQSLAELKMVFFGAAVLVAIAAFLRTWAAAYLQSDVVHDGNVRTEGVVADGPYRFVRNPLYLATCLMTLGLGLMASRTGYLFLIVAITAFQYRLIFREEGELLAARGDRYQAFRNAVPRLFPSPWPRLPAGGVRPRWSQAFIGETFFWGFAAAEFVFAATLKILYALILIAISLLFYIFIVPRLERRRA